jgi:surface antigen
VYSSLTIFCSTTKGVRVVKVKTLCLGIALILAQSVAHATVLQDYEDEKGWSTVCPSGFNSMPDSWNFATCNCTSYVAWRLNRQWQSIAPDNGIRFTNQYRDSEIHISGFIPDKKWGDAKYWGHVAEDLGITVDHNPTVGSVGWRDAGEFNASGSGHVFFVEAVDGNRIKISEYNGDGKYQYHEGWIDASQASGYIHLTASYFQYIQTHQYGSDAYWEIMLHIWECEDMGNICPIGGEGGGVSSYADFVITKHWLEDDFGKRRRSFNPNEHVAMKGQVKNIGGGKSPSAITMKFYRSNGKKVDSNKQTVGTDTIQASSMTVGDTHTETESMNVPATVGTYNTIACADTAKVVTEEHEGNNCFKPYIFRVNPRNTFFGAYEFWYSGGYYGSKLTTFADVDGDGKDDLVVVNGNDVSVKRSTGTGLGGSETWYSGGYYGSKLTAFGDVNGDGKADIVVVNDNDISVMLSTGNSFTNSRTWYFGGYYGDHGTYLADVTGDGKMDIVVVNTSGISVAVSTGDSFQPAFPAWTPDGFWGDIETDFADADGDGKADAIVVNYDKVTVRRSTGSGFGGRESWTVNPYYAQREMVFKDVTGDGRADAIVVNNDSIVIRASIGYGFGAYESWTGNPYYGNVGIYFADVDDNGGADAIVINTDAVVLRRATH